MGAIFEVLTSESALASAVAFASLLAFAASGEWVAERAGTLNISVEGMLLAGAFGAAVGYSWSEQLTVALLFGVLASVAVAAVQAEMSHRLPANQFVVGLALNILVLGLTGFLDGVIDPTTRRASVFEIPLLVDLPLVGSALFGQSWLMYLLYPLVGCLWWMVYRTRWGLEVRASGENPQAADVSGIHVNLRRRQAIYVAGMTSGLGGTYLVMAVVGAFEDSIVGGRGFIALAAVIFGGWTLRGTIAGCVIFGSVVSFRLSLPALGYELNNELLVSLPFIITIGAMAVFATRVRAPQALAQPFVRGLT
jgi:simple sugar transport system permease protein